MMYLFPPSLGTFGIDKPQFKTASQFLAMPGLVETSWNSLAKRNMQAGNADLGMCLMSGELAGDQLKD